MVRTFSVLGPFEDNGGGLSRREGVENAGFDFRSSDASRGAITVRPLRTLSSTATARGVPLDRYVHPRRESCTYLSSALSVPSTGPLVVHVAATGSFRLAWDGRDALESVEHHRRAKLDRAALQVDARQGAHLLTLKVCSGAQADEGRVRLRLSRPDGTPYDMLTSSEPAVLQAALEAARRAAPSSMKRVTTPFERAIALSDEPSVPESLRAATVRLLAGGDDMQSPRAPGMLGLIAATSGIRAQTLAVAGFLAPAGANRSGWLRRAFESAAKEGDDDARAFAQRALILSQLASRQSDLARVTSELPPFSLARDAQAELIRAEIEARLGHQGLKLAALERLTKLAREQGDKTPEATLRTLAQLADSTRPTAHLDALQRLVAIAPGYRSVKHTLAHHPLGYAALEQAALADLPYLDDARDVERLARTLLRCGGLSAALGVYESAARLSPNRVDAHLGIARALQAMGRPDDPRVRVALLRARELEPANTSITAELAFREGRSESLVDLGADAGLLVPPSEFLARARAVPIPPGGVFERQLHWRRIVRMLPDKRISQTIHYAREIGIEPRTDDERVEQAPEASASSELLIARVHRRDGSVLEPTEKDSTGHFIRWPALRRGDVVEIALRSYTQGPVGRRGDAPFYFVDYVGSTASRPVLYNEVILDSPDGGPLAYDVVGGKADRVEVQRDAGRTITRLIWDAPPTIADEPLAPPASETMPVVVGSIYPTWKDFLAWYRGAIEGFTEPDEQIKQVARELTVGKTTREEKLEALFNYVADDIRYVNYTSGEWWLPNRPQHLLARRQGDCDDKANLLISLLGAVGIDATEVLIQTRYTGQPRILFESKIAVPMFDHGIVYLPDGKGGGTFLDATSPQSRLGSVPSMDARAGAVLVSDDAVRAIATPRSAPSDHGVTATFTIALAADGSAKVTTRERHVGDAAFHLRTNLGKADARAQWVESHLLARSLPSAKLEGEVTFDGALPGGAAEVGYGATSRRVARREGEDLIVTFAPPTPLAMQLAPLHERTLPVQLPPHLAPSHHDVAVELIVPEGFRIVEVPPDDTFAESGLGSASQSFAPSADGRRLSVKRTLRFDASRIEVTDYPRWRAWLRHVDTMLHRTMRLQPIRK